MHSKLKYMSNKIKAIYISVGERTVTEISIEDNLDVYNRLIGCRCIDMVSVNSQNDLVVDDEGLFSSKDFFILSGLPQPYRGCLLYTSDAADE